MDRTNGLQEEYELSNGPLSLLQTAVRTNTQVLISLRSNRKLCVALLLTDIDVWNKCLQWR
jgi:hypothetical protein